MISISRVAHQQIAAGNNSFVCVALSHVHVNGGPRGSPFELSDLAALKNRLAAFKIQQTGEHRQHLRHCSASPCIRHILATCTCPFAQIDLQITCAILPGRIHNLLSSAQRNPQPVEFGPTDSTTCPIRPCGIHNLFSYA